MDVVRKLMPGEGAAPAAQATAGEGAPSRIVRDVVITSERRDRQGDIVRVGGARLDRYRQNPVVLLSHGNTTAQLPVIGRALDIRQTSLADGTMGLSADFEFARTPLAQEVNQLWADGFLRATSIGFVPLKAVPINEAGEVLDPRSRAAAWQTAGNEFQEWELLEFSIVAVPANPDALSRTPILRSMLDGGLVVKDSEPEPVATEPPPAGAETTTEEKAPPEGMVVQSVVCSKERFDSADAAASWCSDHDFKTPAVDETADSYRFRQREPGEFAEGTFRTIDLDDGVKAVVGKLAEAAPAPAEEPVNEGAAIRAGLSATADALRSVSVEQCPRCGKPQAYIRTLGRFLPHNLKGRTCPGDSLEPRGVTLKRWLELLGHDWPGTTTAREQMIASGAMPLSLADAASEAASRSSALLRAMQTEWKEGRIISTANLKVLRDAKDALKAAVEAIESLIAVGTKPEPEPVKQVQGDAPSDTSPGIVAATSQPAPSEPDIVAAAIAALADPRVAAAIAQAAKGRATRRPTPNQE